MASDSSVASSPEHGSLFDVEETARGLRGKCVRGAASSTAAEAISFVLNAASIVVLARLLTPDDFGLFAMAAAVTGFLAMFEDAGLSKATIQRAAIRRDQISTLFWINAGLGAFLAVVVAAISPLVASFYGDRRLLAVTAALGAGLLFSGLRFQHKALLQRQMRFVRLAGIRIASLLVGITVAIVAAIAGFGYWALVLKTLALNASYTLGVWVLCGWIPGVPSRHCGVGPMLGFGGNLTAAGFLGYLRRSADRVLLGWCWGAAPLGFYVQAQKLLKTLGKVTNKPFRSVMLTTLSRLQDQPERFVKYYKHTMMLMAGLGMPIVAFAFATTEELVLLVLGPQWAPSIPIFRVLAVAGWVQTTNMAMGLALIPLGQTRRLFRWSIISTPLTIIPIALALPWGAETVAIALTTTIVLQRPLLLAYAFKYTPLRMTHLLDAVAGPACASLLAAAGCIVLRGLIPLDIALWTRLTVLAASYAVAYAASWAASPWGRRDYADLKATLRALVPIPMPRGNSAA